MSDEEGVDPVEGGDLLDLLDPAPGLDQRNANGLGVGLFQLLLGRAGSVSVVGEGVSGVIASPTLSADGAP